MDVPADQSRPTAVQHAPPGTIRRARRRRPTGEAPPLPHHLQLSGVGWLVAAIVLVTLSAVVFARGLRGLAVDVTVADDAVVRWLAGLDAPGVVGLARVLVAISSWWVPNGLLVVLVVSLLALRRLRHLIVFLVLVQAVTLVAESWVGPVAQRPRPFGVEIRAGWGGWALPALQITFFSLGMVTVLYTLVPEGRWRNLGKWVATVLVALTAMGRIALGAEAPSDVLVAVALGVTIPLVGFRLFAPSEVFPITYRRGRAAHAALAAGIVSDNVSHNEGRATPLNIPNLSCGDLEPLWLEAQSVPSASLVPCLRSLPTGWSLQKVTVNDGRSVLTLDSGGGSVVVRMTAGCDPRGATPVASDQAGARRSLRVDQETPEFLATRFDVFAGGCVTTRLAAPTAKRSELVAEMGALLDFTTRQSLQRALERRSNGRLHLDPGRP